MKQFTQAAVNTMGQSNPGFSGFMNNVFQGGGDQSRQNGMGSGANPGFGMPNMQNREMPPNVNTDAYINNIPNQLTLKPNYTNPFNPNTKISFNLPQSSKVKLQIVYIRQL